MGDANHIRSASDILAERKRKRAAAGQPAPQRGPAATALTTASIRKLAETRQEAPARSLKEVRDARRLDAAREDELRAPSRDRRDHPRHSERDAPREFGAAVSQQQAPNAWARDGWSRIGEAPPRDTLASPIAKDAAHACGPVIERKSSQSLTVSAKRSAEAERPPITFERSVKPRSFEAGSVSATAIQSAARSASRGERDQERSTPRIEKAVAAAFAPLAAIGAPTAAAPPEAAEPGLGPTAAAPKEITDGVGEKAFRQRKAAEALLRALPPGSLQAAGGSSSRVPAEMVADSQELLLQRLVDLGGMTGEACNKMRLFIGDWKVNVAVEAYMRIGMRAEGAVRGHGLLWVGGAWWHRTSPPPPPPSIHCRSL